MRKRVMTMAAVALLAGCGREEPAEAGEVAAEDGSRQCRIAARAVELPSDVHETSGAVFHPGRTDVFWTHNDSGDDPLLYAIDGSGRILGRVRLDGARNQDWEALAAGPCASGACLYVGDIGNNRRKRNDAVVLYRVPLPAPEDGTVAAEAFRATFPGGGRDAEALFALPDGSLYLVNKGNDEEVALYRWPTPLEPGPVELERVRALAPEPGQPGDRVTDASASPDGRWVAVRTYGTLAFYRTAELVAGGDPAFTVDLAALGEAQGEAVALLDGGLVLLTSEAGETLMPGRATVLQCDLPAE